MVGQSILGSTPSLPKDRAKIANSKMDVPAPIDFFLIRWDPIQSF